MQSGIWREANSLTDPSLRRLVPNLTSPFTVGVQGSFHRTEIQIWLAEVARQWRASKTGVQVNH